MKKVNKLIAEENKLRREYMRNDAAMLLHIVAILLGALVVVILVLMVTAPAKADDLELVMDLLPEGDGLVIGRIGDDHVTLQKLGDQTTGTIGDKSIYLHEIEQGDWGMTTGRIGDEDVNINKWDWENDDDG